MHAAFQKLSQRRQDLEFKALDVHLRFGFTLGFVGPARKAMCPPVVTIQMFLVLALVGKISAILVVHFAAGDWRIEGADQTHILGATAQDVAVVLV